MVDRSGLETEGDDGRGRGGSEVKIAEFLSP